MHRISFIGYYKRVDGKRQLVVIPFGADTHYLEHLRQHTRVTGPFEAATMKVALAVAKHRLDSREVRVEHIQRTRPTRLGTRLSGRNGGGKE